MFENGAIIGEICHIHGQRPGAARCEYALTTEELHGIENLILLCRNHHKLVDDNPGKYATDWLR